MAAVVLALVLGGALVAMAMASRDDGDTQAIVDEDAAGDDDPADGGPTTEAEGPDDDGSGGEVAVPEASCPVDAFTPEVRRVWQDASGTHLIVVITTTCEGDQVLNDPAAQFALTVEDDTLVDGTFDFSATPISVPTTGSEEIELIFDGEARTNTDRRFTVFLPTNEGEALTEGVGVRYLFVCEPDDGSGAATGTLGSEAPADLAGAAAVAAVGTPPIDPRPGDDAAALTVLEQIHTEQAGARAAIEGQWVPQVATKSLEDDPSTPQDDRVSLDFWTDRDIQHTPSVFLERFRAWQSRYPNALLIRGSDFQSICGDNRSARCLGFWLIAIAEPQPSGEAVFFDWCEPEGLNALSPDPNNRHCIGKLFQQTDSAGTTFIR